MDVRHTSPRRGYALSAVLGLGGIGLTFLFPEIGFAVLFSALVGGATTRFIQDGLVDDARDISQGFKRLLAVTERQYRQDIKALEERLEQFPGIKSQLSDAHTEKAQLADELKTLKSQLSKLEALNESSQVSLMDMLEALDSEIHESIMSAIEGPLDTLLDAIEAEKAKRSWVNDPGFGETTDMKALRAKEKALLGSLTQQGERLETLRANYEQRSLALQPQDYADPRQFIQESMDLLSRFHAECSSSKIKFRNTLSCGQRYHALSEAQRLQQQQREMIPRQQAIASVDAVQNEFEKTNQTIRTELEENYQNLESTSEELETHLGTIDRLTERVADLQQQLDKAIGPRLWQQATRSDLLCSNQISQFYAEQCSIVLDRALASNEQWVYHLAFHYDRNLKPLEVAQLNYHSEALRQRVNALKAPLFKLDPESELVRVSVEVARKPADASKLELPRFCKPVEFFLRQVPKWKIVRITGGSEAGKTPTAIIIGSIWQSSRGGEFYYSNPQDNSQKNYTGLTAVARSHKESAKLMQAVVNRLDARAKGYESKAHINYIFDEIDGTLSSESQDFSKAMLRVAKEASHQNIYMLVIGQYGTVKNIGLQWTDLNNFTLVYIGNVAIDYLNNADYFTTDEKERLKRQANKLIEYCAAKNESEGMSHLDANAYRFALVRERNGQTYFSMLPVFGEYGITQTSSDETISETVASMGNTPKPQLELSDSRQSLEALDSNECDGVPLVLATSVKSPLCKDRRCVVCGHHSLVIVSNGKGRQSYKCINEKCCDFNKRKAKSRTLAD